MSGLIVGTSGRAVNIATSESRTNVAYGTLTTPDQVMVALPTNGLIAVWYQATWQESVLNAARAAICLNGNQLQIQKGGTPFGPATVATGMGNPSGTGVNTSLTSSHGGLMSVGSGVVQAADATTGQLVGGFGTYTYPYEVNGTIQASPALGLIGGAAYIFAAAGTYTVSIQFKASSGSVTASNRKLWVMPMAFG